MKYKAVLYDCDGVVDRQPELFAHFYARQHGIDPGELGTFFDADFLDASLGKADLKELVAKRNDLWQWSGSPNELLQQWFEFENHPDQALVAVIQRQRAQGIGVYMATIQEKYRAEYLREVMFPDLFDNIFASCDLGFHKKDSGFFEAILTSIRKTLPDLQPEEIAYFDDRHEGLLTAAELGIATFLYESVEQVEAVIG